mmetsp:Transcript_14607/g.41091  ORF Transcript_14607/g.41091 Transcript_14607/m.41091 type:complete len:304 (-) Transcript_14607:30-941(-)
MWSILAARLGVRGKRVLSSVMAPSPGLRPQASSRLVCEDAGVSSARACERLCRRPLRNWWRPWRIPACASAARVRARMRLPHCLVASTPSALWAPCGAVLSSCSGRHGSTPASSALMGRRCPASSTSVRMRCTTDSRIPHISESWGCPSPPETSDPSAMSSSACTSNFSLILGELVMAAATSTHSMTLCIRGRGYLRLLKSRTWPASSSPPSPRRPPPPFTPPCCTAAASLSLSLEIIISREAITAAESTHSASRSAETSLSGKLKCRTASAPNSYWPLCVVDVQGVQRNSRECPVLRSPKEG